MGFFDGLRGKTLYFPGCSAKFLVNDIQRRHEQLLTIFGIDYVKFPEMEVCCGKPALDYGYKNDFHALVRKNSELFKNQGIKKIITSASFCSLIFAQHYGEVEVEHISETILKNIHKIKKDYEGEQVTFFDACNPQKLGHLYDTPRKILEAVGFRLVELEFAKEKSLCCGQVLKPISPKVSSYMAEAVLDAVPTKKLITMSPDCYAHFKENNPKNLKILELSEVLL